MPEVSFDQLQKWEVGNDIWATVLIKPAQSTVVASVPPVIQQLLQKHQDLFQQPSTLPPHIEFDH